MPFHLVLPLPHWVLHPFTSVFLGAVHVYLAAGHISQLFGAGVQWTASGSGFECAAGAYVFAALASRGLARHEGRHHERQMPQQDSVHISPPTGNSLDNGR